MDRYQSSPHNSPSLHVTHVSNCTPHTAQKERRQEQTDGRGNQKPVESANDAIQVQATVTTVPLAGGSIVVARTATTRAYPKRTYLNFANAYKEFKRKMFKSAKSKSLVYSVSIARWRHCNCLWRDTVTGL